jgi:hypothetical protein
MLKIAMALNYVRFSKTEKNAESIALKERLKY